MHIYWWFSLMPAKQNMKICLFKIAGKGTLVICVDTGIEKKMLFQNSASIVKEGAWRCSITLRAKPRVEIYNFPFLPCHFIVKSCFPKTINALRLYEHKMCACSWERLVTSHSFNSVSALFGLVFAWFYIYWNCNNITNSRCFFIISWFGANFAAGTSFWYTVTVSHTHAHTHIKFNEQWQIWLSVNWLIIDSCPYDFHKALAVESRATIHNIPCVEWRQFNSLSSAVSIDTVKYMK